VRTLSALRQISERALRRAKSLDRFEDFGARVWGEARDKALDEDQLVALFPADE
jgi:hypothetical protein